MLGGICADDKIQEKKKKKKTAEGERKSSIKPIIREIVIIVVIAMKETHRQNRNKNYKLADFQNVTLPA